MEMWASTNWLVDCGSLDKLPRIGGFDVCSTGSSSSSSSSSSDCNPQLRLCRPQAGGACSLTLKRQDLTPEQQVFHQLVLVSTAKLCELAVQRPGDASPSYVSTTRAQPTTSGQFYEATINLQAVSGWQVLELKLLSLQGVKDSCTVCDLALLTRQCDKRQQAPSIGSEHDKAAGPASAPQAVLSQLDELRLLNDSVQKLAAADGGNSSVPESLQLLFSKASQQPAGGGAALKYLSSMVAQGMLQQQSAQRQQQLQQQHMQADTQAVQLQVQQQQPAAQQQPAVALVGPGQRQLKSGYGAGCSDNFSGSASSSSSGSSSGQQAVVLALQCIESKLDSLATQLLAAVDRLSQQQQQLWDRLDAIEQRSQQEALQAHSNQPQQARVPLE